MTLYKRFFSKPSQSFFLFGPRGTGKSTLMWMQNPEALWIDLMLPEVLRAYLGNPERLFDILQANSDKKIVVIDEVQKAPSLLSVVHAVIEQKRGIQFILTGSSSRKLKRSGADLLGGRALKRTLHPLMASEMGEGFSLKRGVVEGTIPLIVTAQSYKDSLDAYIQLYLQEEIQAEGLVRSLEQFSRFLQAISFSHGSLLNTTNVANECGVKRKTVENYINILEELLLAYRLPIFTKRAKRELVAHPKFYLFDAGVFQTLKLSGPFDTTKEGAGAALEGLVFQNLLAWNDYSRESHEIYFWRTRSGVEVDFVVYGPSGVWAIEVKHGKQVHNQDTKSLEAFKQDYPMAKTLLLYCGKERLIQNNVLCLPCDEFLWQLIPNKELWPI